MWTNSRKRRFVLAPLIAFALQSGLAAPPALANEAKPAEPVRNGQSYRVPYQLTETKHILVRAKINGKGPFNFIVDTGAPLLYLGTEAARKAGLKADKSGWATFDRVEIEGGIVLDKQRARIEDPFQLTGMNKMNLPGIRYDGILGYTILAQFRIQFDFTDTHLAWTKLDWKPPLPMGLADLGGKAPPELAGMGVMVSLVAGLMGRRPDPELVFRGLIGIELQEQEKGIRIKKVLPESPAAEAGLRDGDRLTKFQDKEVATLKELHDRAADKPAGQDVQVEIERGGETRTVTVKTIKGL